VRTQAGFVVTDQLQPVATSTRNVPVLAMNENPALPGVSVTAHELGADGVGVAVGFGVAVGAGGAIGAGVEVGTGVAGGDASATAAVVEPDCAIVNGTPFTVIVPVRVADPNGCDTT
jgi:hypothetical protein